MRSLASRSSSCATWSSCSSSSFRARSCFWSSRMVRCVLTRASTSSAWNGLWMKSTAPSSRPRTLSRASVSADRNTTAASRVRGVGLQPLAGLEAVDVGHHHVEQDQVGHDALRDRDGVLGAPRCEQAIAAAVERLIENLEVGGVVVHQQNLRCVACSVRSRQAIRPGHGWTRHESIRRPASRRAGPSPSKSKFIASRLIRSPTAASPVSPAISSAASCWISVTSPSATASRRRAAICPRRPLSVSCASRAAG